MLALTTGVVALLAGLLRLGFVANFISEPVLKGFIIGLALTDHDRPGPEAPRRREGRRQLLRAALGFPRQLGDTQRPTLAGRPRLLGGVGLRRFAPAVPGSLVAVLFGIVASAVFDLDAHGVEIVGHIRAGSPSSGCPTVGLSDYLGRRLRGGHHARRLRRGTRRGEDLRRTQPLRDRSRPRAPRTRCRKHRRRTGSGMVVNGSLSKTAVNGSAGAHAAVGPPRRGDDRGDTAVPHRAVRGLPRRRSAAVVIAALIELVDSGRCVELYHLYIAALGPHLGHAARPDFLAAMAAMFGVLVFDTLPGLFIGISRVRAPPALPRLEAARRRARPGAGHRGSSSPTVERHPENPVPGVVIERVEGGLFFANADAVRDALGLARPSRARAVVLDAGSIPFVDITASACSSSSWATWGRDVQLHRPRIGQVRDMLREDGGDGRHAGLGVPDRPGRGRRLGRAVTAHGAALPVRAVPRVDPALRPPVAREGPRRWARRRRGGDPAGDGVRDDRRPVGGGGPLHVHAADGRLRAPRRLAHPLGEHHVHDRRPHRVDARRRGHRRRCVGSAAPSRCSPSWSASSCSWPGCSASAR